MSQTASPVVPSTLFLSDADVASLSDWPSAVAALAAAYARTVDAATVPPRSMARGDGLWLRSLSAISPTGPTMGCKLIAASPRARCASYLIALFDRQTMALTALIDGNRVTGLRTAAAAAVAVDRLAPQRPLRVGVIGAGFEARGALDCLAAVRAVQSARVFSPTPANRERFADGFRCAIDIAAVGSAEAAVDGMDVVICAARSRDETPVLRGLWLAEGATVVSLGSTLPEQREVDADTMARAACIVADMPEEVAHDTGDAIAAARAGVDITAKLVSLTDLVLNLHLATPETATTCHYWFWTTRNFAIAREANVHIRGFIEHTFTQQDKPMLEAQQRRMGDAEFWSLRPVLLAGDAGTVRVRRKLQGLIEKEAAA